MFEISELKEKTLADLQVIAKTIGLSKVSQLKKLDLIYQILDTQASATNLEKAADKTADKPKRKRISKTNGETLQRRILPIRMAVLKKTKIIDLQIRIKTSKTELTLLKKRTQLKSLVLKIQIRKIRSLKILTRRHLVKIQRMAINTVILILNLMELSKVKAYWK